MAAAVACAFDDDLYSDLGDALALREAVPAHVEPLWEHCTACRMCLGRVEEARAFSASVSAGFTAERAALSLVLSVSLAAVRCRVALTEQARAFHAAARVAALTSPHRGGEAESGAVVEFPDEMSIRVEEVGDVLEVTIMSRSHAVENVGVAILDGGGRTLSDARTDDDGVARHPRPADGDCRIRFDWDQPEPPG